MDEERVSPRRRALLKGAVGLAALSVSPSGWPQASREEAVWLDMTQAELDRAYTQGHWAPNIREVIARYATRSAAAIDRLGPPETFAYGDIAAETVEVHSGGGTGLPVHVFIHGGAWESGDARDYAFLAEPFVNAGAHFVAVNYSSVDDTGGDLMPLGDQVRRAVRWIYRHAGEFGGDPSRIYLSGHSSGGHLAGVVLTTDWPGRFDAPMDIVKGGLCVSGMFDLEPVALSSRSDYVAFNEKTVRELSPLRHLENLRAPVVVACGSLESPEFQRQSREFVRAATAAGKPVELLVGEHFNHFEIIETMANPYGLLGRAALGQMGLIR